MQEAKICNSTEALTKSLQDKVTPGLPSFFRLETMLPKQGRTDIAMAATPNMTVMLKAYAATGENVLHAHVNEDHVFMVLQGQATFYGPGGEEKVIGCHEGVMLPKGTFYWFRATSEEPLVMVRVGAVSNTGALATERIGFDGKPMDGYSEANKEIPVVLSGDYFR